MTEDRLYVYGVVEDVSLDLELDAVDGGTRVYTVDDRSLAAVVSEVDDVEPERTEENLRRHDDVLRSVMEYGDGVTVIPMQFGMVFEGERPLKNVLRHARPALTRALRETDGRVELGVKVLAGEGANGDRDGVREAVTAELDPLSVGATDGEAFSDRLVLNRSYLVEREDREAFDQAVGRIQDRYDDYAVHYSGPWAPYSFVDVEIGVRG